MQVTPSDPIHQLYGLRGALSQRTPSIRQASNFIEATLGVLFPHFSEGNGATIEALEDMSTAVCQLLNGLLESIADSTSSASSLVADFRVALPSLHSQLLQDAEAINHGDPAAKSVDEVIAAYPGFYAIAVYRIAHWLYERAVPILPRLLTECAHRVTGIDIHPGATIGAAFVIDHGTGIVIGETTVIKDNVKIYQGVTLGALSVEKNLADKKRHPTIEEGVVIYANATILGGGTIIGAGTTVGGNVWITGSVAPNSRVYHKADNVISNSTKNT